MGGGLMQLVAYGAQDIYLTGNPQITFFKVVYRRHTNFAMECIEQVFSGNVTLGKKTSCTIARNGDLLYSMHLDVDITGVSENGHEIINYVDIEIGGQCIDKHYGKWLNIWADLTHNKEQKRKLDRMINGDLCSNDGCSQKLYVPLQFWFNRNPGLALPLIALQYHEVKLNLLLNKSVGNIGTENEPEQQQLNNICLFCDYIFLDTDERRRFAQVSHEYLIEQVQYNGKHSSHGSVDNIELRFNHPCKEIVWCGVTDSHKAVLQLNGHDRFREREGTYFRSVQQWQHNSGVPNSSSGIYSYSFALKPEEHQPSGTCNFSRIDNAVLTIEQEDCDSSRSYSENCIEIYAVNYNVLRIMSGMGGLAYSN